jgi:hypothetical protein
MQNIGLVVKIVSSVVVLGVIAIGSYFYYPSKVKQEALIQQPGDVAEETLTPKENKEAVTIEPKNAQEVVVTENVKEEDTSKNIAVSDTKIATDNTKKEVDDKKKSDKKKEESKKKNSNEDEKKESKPCFAIDDKYKYAENVYYKGNLSLDAACSKESSEYQWYFNGSNSKSGQKVTYSGGGFGGSPTIKVGGSLEIKLITTSKDGLTASTTKTITFRDIPKPTVCFNQDSSKVKSFKLGEEYTFDASCSTFSDENPITRYSWKFRDGGQDDAVVKEDVKVKHAFSKPTTTASGGGCNDGLLSVDLIIETKLGSNGSHTHTYCIDKVTE